MLDYLTEWRRRVWWWVLATILGVFVAMTLALLGVAIWTA